MDRREMLEESLRTVARALPRMFGVIGGIDRVLKMHEEVRASESVTCFPDGPDEVHPSKDDTQ